MSDTFRVYYKLPSSCSEEVAKAVVSLWSLTHPTDRWPPLCLFSSAQCLSRLSLCIMWEAPYSSLSLSRRRLLVSCEVSKERFHMVGFHHPIPSHTTLGVEINLHSMRCVTFPSNDGGGPAVSHKWPGWVWEITGWSYFKTAEKLPISLEEFIEYIPI